MIYIVNYGLGNLGSIANMLNRLGIESKITDNPKEIEYAEKLILPGVGSFDTGIISLKNMGWFDILNKKVLIDKTPILGICLGMQLMTASSEEGKEMGLNWVDASTRKFAFQDNKLKIPHMGWNMVGIKKESNLVRQNYQNAQRFYFVHSFRVHCANNNDVLSTTFYGDEFVSSFQHENIYGVQFHPEKSHKFGMQLLDNFARLC